MAEPHPNNPNIGTPEEDRFSEHSIPTQDKARQETVTSARPGTQSGGAGEKPTAPIKVDSDEKKPHNMSSDLSNPQNGEETLNQHKPR